MKKYLVGGAVRDKLLGLVPKDFDYVLLETNEDELLSLGYKKISNNFPVFTHKDYPEAQFSLARTEKKTGTGYHGFTVDTKNVSLKDDLERRDFTINSMALDEQTNEVFDYFNGQADLKNKVLRHTGKHFIEDPLRMLRTARFSSRLEFSVAQETKDFIKEMLSNGMFDEINHSRITQEFEKSITEGYGQKFIFDLDELGLLDYIFKGYDLTKIRFQAKKLKFVKKISKFYKDLLYSQIVDMKINNFLMHVGMDTILEINEVSEKREKFLNYNNLTTKEKANLLYKSRFKGSLKMFIREINLIKKNDPVLEYKNIVEDFKKIQSIDFSSVANESDKKLAVFNLLIKTLESKNE